MSKSQETWWKNIWLLRIVVTPVFIIRGHDNCGSAIHALYNICRDKMKW